MAKTITTAKYEDDVDVYEILRTISSGEMAW